MLTPNQLLRLGAAAQAAVACEHETGLPAEITVAQWALESGWGSAAPGNNCFGIKEYAGCHGRQLLHTVEWFTDSELQWFLSKGDGRTAELVHPVQTDKRGAHKYAVQDWFSTFASLGDCFAKRAAMWDKGPYAKAADQYRQDNDLVSLVRNIAPIYAKDPAYADQVLAIIRQSDVQAAWQTAQREVTNNATA